MDFNRLFATALRYPLSVSVFIPVIPLVLFFTYFTLERFLQWFPEPLYPATLVFGISATLIAKVVAYLAVYMLVATPFLVLYTNNAARFFARQKREPLGKSVAVVKQRSLGTLATGLLSSVPITMLFTILSAFSMKPTNLTSLLLYGIVIIAVLLFEFFLGLAPTIYVIDRPGVLKAVKSSFRTVRKNKLNMFMFWAAGIGLFFLILLPMIIVSLFYLALVSPLAFLNSDIFLAISAVPFIYFVLFLYAAYANFYLSTKKK